MRKPMLTLAVCAAFAAGCGTTPVKQESLINLTSSQIKEINNYQELVSLRKTLLAGLAGKPQADFAEDYATLAQIESQIVELKKNQLATKLASSRSSDGFVPLDVLDNLLQDVSSNPAASESRWAAVVTQLENERAKTSAEAEKLEATLEGQTLESRIETYNSLFALTGSGQWQQKRDQEVDALVADIREASINEEFDESIQDKIEVVRNLRGDDASLVDELIGVDARIYAKRYFDALSDGAADKAYDVLVAMSQAKDFEAIKGKLAATSEKMAEYFTALADESVDKPENLSQSYRWYSQAREVRSILGLPAASSTKQPQLISQLDGQFNSLKKAGEEAAALAYLYALQDFDARRPGLRKLINDQEAVVRDSAVKRLSTTDFQSRYSDQDYGDVISTFITQYLFEHVPHDVRIVEREQYEAIQREREISGDSAALASVNLLVSGSVLESKVDSSEAKNKKMMRVTVGKESIPNPAYVSWLKLPSKERKKVDQPSETIDVDKHENVSVEMTRHRKVGIFSVSYRLVEATTGRVIFPDSITVDSRHEDESNEGVEMGDFVQTAKLADLPSDVEILDDLAKKVATEIGKKLVEELKDQELKYLASAEQSAAQNDCVGEVQALGNALMITRLKAKESDDLYGKFKNGAVACY